MNTDVDAVDLPDGACCTSGMQCASTYCDYRIWTCSPLLEDGTTADSDTASDTADADAESEAGTSDSAAPTATSGIDAVDAEVESAVMTTDSTGADTTDTIQDCATNMNTDVDAVGLPDGACCTSGMQCASTHCDYGIWTCSPLLEDGTTADSDTAS